MAANIAAASTVNKPISTAKPPIFTLPRYGKSQPSFGSLQRESPNTTIANWIAQPRYRSVTQTPILLNLHLSSLPSIFKQLVPPPPPTQKRWSKITNT
ncbi:hypothetical protein HanIR_Chr00c29g0911911 [Helianthus annuus]|nr:hypothetical protein HanIR_Chr00c29g0911911 [Helianthus annuus]